MSGLLVSLVVLLGMQSLTDALRATLVVLERGVSVHTEIRQDIRSLASRAHADVINVQHCARVHGIFHKLVETLLVSF